MSMIGTSGVGCEFCGQWVPVGQIHICPKLQRDRPIGCICPPGANKECERVDCPRKARQP